LQPLIAKGVLTIEHPERFVATSSPLFRWF